jgi:hypothetical protein
MPIASLRNFTVPIAGAQAATTQGLLMPKLKYRFRVTMDGFGVAGAPTTELTKQVMNVARPDVTFDTIELPVYNSKIKLLGKHNWADTKLTLRDDASGVVSRKVGEQLQKQFDFFEQASAQSAIDYKFRMRVEVLDGGNGGFEPVTLESFEFLGCFVKQATYAQGDYSSNEIMDIALTISYDNAIQLEAPGGAASGVGVNVGRVVRPGNAQGLATGG